MLKNIEPGSFANWLRFISVGIYIFSLTQQSFCTEQNCADGAGCIIGGLFGFLLSIPGVVWIANPILFASWISVFKNPRTSLKTSTIATIIALSFLFFKNGRIVVDEAGHYSKITSFQLGYWIWVLSSVLMTGGSLYLLKLLEVDENNSPPQ